MYIPDHFREDRAPVLHAAMRAIGLATLVTAGEEARSQEKCEAVFRPGPRPIAIEANHLPLLLDEDAGILRGHFARANPVWRRLKPDTEALAVFLGPHAYIRPGWYPGKAETGKAVPTWNYITVHARGTITTHQDADWLKAHVGALSDTHETGRAQPWALTDAPPVYIDTMLRAIVGFELRIARLEGKWKLSQNRPAADIAGARDGLAQGGHDALAALMGGA